ncbi:small GTP-binding protein domain containing protein [Theileria equi strain WA]|uniref:Small GTP-binding protein domain containing protein n=1 Tax=Theileria equi strain WA TaxID=1537102 RepID=L1LD13_THEEQ|nr:small GTP-binding protein domain containing protein [Theileria equi strain WA]EKX73140.1 small GTP-binding protein domain containing protein [Theileria equi strain WA]|eukprot:XP_004832592.1 small GTP-binding protein domain containing protein [Theileria equi strain WA]
MKDLQRVVNNPVVYDRVRFSGPIVDIKRIKCIGGKGGDGALAFSKHGPHRLMGPGLPVGGSGGRGGSIYAAPITRADERCDLKSIPSIVRAQNGSNGLGGRTSGMTGEDIILRVPLGTLIYKFDPVGDLDNWRANCKNWKKKLIADINSTTYEKVLLALGGRGGSGNNMKTPYESESGKEPEENYYEIELKSIADIGLLGLPNVGKSTLLSSVTRANAKIAAYPFTTLSPYIGYIKYTDGASLSMADLPGIVECRLTQEFLRHVERTKALLYVIDACNPTYTPMENFMILRAQVEEYGSDLAQKPYAVVISKMDVASERSAKVTDDFYRQLRDSDIKCNVIPTSAKLGLGLSKLACELRTLVNLVGISIDSD